MAVLDCAGKTASCMFVLASGADASVAALDESSGAAADTVIDHERKVALCALAGLLAQVTVGDIARDAAHVVLGCLGGADTSAGDDLVGIVVTDAAAILVRVESFSALVAEVSV